MGETHPHTLMSLNNLGSLYHVQEQYDLAAPLYEDCLTKSRAILGEAHHSTLYFIHNLAELYEQQGKAELSAQLYAELEVKRNNASDDHQLHFTMLLQDMNVVSVRGMLADC